MKKSDTSAQQENNHESIYGREALVIPEIQKFNKGIATQDKTLKYCRMASSPFSFYRGTDHLYWKDFATDWRLTRFGNAQTRSWINGDCHAYNFGAFQQHGKGVVYGLNDFDESIIADYQLDLWRLAISLVLIAEQNKTPKGKSLDKALDNLAENYLDTLAALDGKKKALHLVYDKNNTIGRLQKFIVKTAKKESRGKMIEKWTTEKEGRHVFDVENNDKIEAIKTRQQNALIEAFPSYIESLDSDIEFGPGYFQIEDIACRKLAGTGSLGVDRYYVLLKGDPQGGHDNDLILDVKEQPGPSGYPFLPLPWRKDYNASFANEGVRYVRAYRALSHHADDHLGWMKIGKKYFGVSERNPYKESFDTSKLKTAKDFNEIAGQWGMILATEHNRASINEKIKTFQKAVGKCVKGKRKEFCHIVKEVAHGYAAIVNSDHEIFKKVLDPKDCPPEV